MRQFANVTAIVIDDIKETRSLLHQLLTNLKFRRIEMADSGEFGIELVNRLLSSENPKIIGVTNYIIKPVKEEVLLTKLSRIYHERSNCGPD